MPRNVEIKAKVDNMEALKRLAEDRSGQKPTVILQRDTFFKVASGRLKLRFLQVNCYLQNRCYTHYVTV